MSVNIEAEQEAWLRYFNPCGIEPVRGFVLQMCSSPNCMRIHCMLKSSYAMAGYLLKEATSVDTEKAEFGDYLRNHMLGNEVVMTPSETVWVSKESIPTIVGRVAQKAETIVQEVSMCVRMGTPLSESYLEECTQAQRDVLDRLGDNARFLGWFRGDRQQADAQEKEAQNIIREALDMDLGELGLVARYAIGFGLGDRVPQYSMSQMFRHPGIGQLKEIPS